MAARLEVDKAVLMAAFARLDVVAFTVALGTVCALILLLATAALLLKGASPGIHVGQHLALLGIYLPGYEVSWGGSILGAAYAWCLGAFAGFVLALLWNLTHYLYVAAIVVRTAWWRMMAD